MMRRTLTLLPVLLVSATACESGNDGNIVVGQTESDRIELSAETTESVVEILVAEGDAVRAGQVLLRQDMTRATARLVEAEAAVGEAKARLDELQRGPRSEQIRAARANVAGAEKELEFRLSDYERVKKVHAQNLASAELLDRAKAALDAARASDELRRAQLQELLTGTTVEQLQQAEQALKRAEARRELAAIDLARHEIRAPDDALVDSRLIEVGERPVPGQPLMVLLGGEQAYARVYVPEHLRVSVRPGTKAAIQVDGLEKTLDGRVRWVASEAAFTPYFALTERDRGHLSFAAKIDFIGLQERLPDGVPVQVEIDIASRDD
ncbi:MAG: HlyD family efflux transporter periplasmic adaptor subunit [Gammaproteobacteria bacterium]|nr:HlyD family efflux transporter periplasmic adaptor subunit [Gammaproteobacteria bacterium]